MTGFTAVVLICSVIISVASDHSAKKLVSELFDRLSATSVDQYIKDTTSASNKYNNAAKFYEQVWSTAYKRDGKTRDAILKEYIARFEKLDQATKDYIKKGWRETFKKHCK